METKQVTVVGVLCVLSMLAGFGGNVYLNKDKLDSTYYCNLTGEIAVFERLSSTGKTGYYINNSLEGNMEEESIPCRIGRTWQSWILLSEYLKQNNLSLESLIKKDSYKEIDYSPKGKVWICDVKGCIPGVGK